MAVAALELEDDAEEIDDGLKQSCWANMPQELLREVLIRIESSENKWPSRKNVVGCATVCRSWREIMKEIVKRPEISGMLTFPISVKQVYLNSYNYVWLFHFFVCLDDYQSF